MIGYELFNSFCSFLILFVLNHENYILFCMWTIKVENKCVNYVWCLLYKHVIWSKECAKLMNTCQVSCHCTVVCWVISPQYIDMLIESKNISSLLMCNDRLCGLVVRVSGYRYRGLGFDSRRCQIFWVVVGLERGPLSLVRSFEELLE